MGLRHTVRQVSGPLAILLAFAGMAVSATPPGQQAPAQPAAVRAQVNSPAQASAPAPQAAPAAAPSQVPSVARPAAGRRDPFRPLVGQDQNGPTPERLPPGKAGLLINTMRLDGLVRGPNGMIAVVASPQQRIYFLREGERVYDGEVTRITMDAITFLQSGRDAFGNPVQREVTRRLYPISGE